MPAIKGRTLCVLIVVQGMQMDCTCGVLCAVHTAERWKCCTAVQGRGFNPDDHCWRPQLQHVVACPDLAALPRVIDAAAGVLTTTLKVHCSMGADLVGLL